MFTVECQILIYTHLCYKHVKTKCCIIVIELCHGAITYTFYWNNTNYGAYYIYTDWRLIIACIFYHLSFSFYVSFLLFFLKFWFVIYAAYTCISVYPLSNDIHFFIFNCNMIIFPYDWINIKKNRYWIFVICKALS